MARQAAPSAGELAVFRRPVLTQPRWFLWLLASGAEAAVSLIK